MSEPTAEALKKALISPTVEKRGDSALFDVDVEVTSDDDHRTRKPRLDDEDSCSAATREESAAFIRSLWGAR